MSHLPKSAQPGLPLPNLAKKPHRKRLTELPETEVKLNAGDHVNEKLETCLRHPPFIQTKVKLISESHVKGICPASESVLHKSKKGITTFPLSSKNMTGMPRKKSRKPKDARSKLRMSSAADATFEMQRDQQKSIVDCANDGACGGSIEVSKHLRISENDCSVWETEEKTMGSTFLVNSSLVEQDADLLKSVDAVQNDLSKRCVNVDWSDATFQVESGLAKLEGKALAQHELRLTYAALTDDDKVELEVLPKSKVDYYKTCYDVSLPFAKASFTNLLRTGFDPVVESVSDHQALCNTNGQQKTNDGVLNCGGTTDSSTDQLTSELSNYNYHQLGNESNHSIVCYENIGSQYGMPSPSKCINSPSKDSDLESNLTFLHTSTPRALAENVLQNPSGQLRARMRSRVFSDRQNKFTKSKAAGEVEFSDALLVKKSLKFDPYYRSTSSTGNATRDLECDRKSSPRNLKVVICNEKLDKSAKNNDLLLLSSCCKQSGLEMGALEKLSPVQLIPQELASDEGEILCESAEGKSSSSEAFNELEFEVFENEDYRVKPEDDALVSCSLQNSCSRRHRSIVDFNEESMASFFLTDVVNLTHLCRISYSADNVDAVSHQQSKASPLRLHRSFSSPDKFSDLSFAQLPIFGAELALKSECKNYLNLEQRMKESRRAHGSVSRAASEMSVGLSNFVEDLKIFDVFLPNADLCIGPKACSAGAELEHLAKVKRSDNDDIDEDSRRSVLSTRANNICLDSDPQCNDRLHFQDAFSTSDALNLPAGCAMTTELPSSSANLTPAVGSNVAAVGRPVSSTRRQLPVPQVVVSGNTFSSRTSPPKSQLPHKGVPEKTDSSVDNCMMVQVEMEKPVKVEMVKQVKVSCAVQEKCESKLPSAILNKDDPKITGAGSVRNDSPMSPLASSRQKSNRTSKIGIPLSKASAVPSGRSSAGAQLLIEQGKEKSESDRSGAVSAPPVGIQYPIRKGTPRQLPNADLVKHAKQRETVEIKVAKPDPAKTNNVPQLRRLSVFKNIEKMAVTNKTKPSAKSSNLATKPMIEISDCTSSKTGKTNTSVNSSASSSASSVPTATQRRSLLLSQVTAANLTQKHGREIQVADPNCKRMIKTNAELKPVKEEPKPGVQNEKRVPETNSKELSNSQRPNAILAVRKSLTRRSGLPAKKQSLASVVNKEPVCSRRASSGSVCSSSKSEIIGQNSAPLHNSQSPSWKQVKGIKSVEDAVSVQYAHQPDVVSTSVLRDLPIKKFELECKDMARRLHSSAVQLKERTTAFEAMITVVRYYLKQITSLSENISVLRSQLVSSNNKCDVLMYHRNALISEIQGLKEDHEVEVNGMTVTHQMELHALQEKTKAAIKEVEERHLKMAVALHEETHLLIEDLKSEHKKELETFGQSVSESEAKHKQKLTDLQRSHDNRLKDFKSQFETVKSALMEKVDHLNAECIELRQRNQNLLDADPNALNNFVTPEAEKQAENLKQEVESLKVVVELRNQENNKLRKHNVALEAQLQELGETKQRIHQLEQKLENTEAIVHMKSENERELAEKHTTLLRRYSKESKVNKRLSMNNEELMWKLNQAAVAPSASPNPIRRSYSGPPTKSAPGTPLVFRRSQPEMESESFFSSDDSAKHLQGSG